MLRRTKEFTFASEAGLKYQKKWIQQSFQKESWKQNTGSLMLAALKQKYEAVANALPLDQHSGDELEDPLSSEN